MGYKLDVREIVSHHFSTIVNDNTGKRDFRDWFFFLILPAGIAGVLSWRKIFLSDDYINALISGLSIYVGMSLNLIVLIFDMVQRNTLSSFRKSFAKDLIANITFSVLLSILSIIFSLLTQVEFSPCGALKIYKLWMNFLAYFLIIQMILSVLLLVRNMYFQLLDRISD